jgi:hypothetical protein
MCHAEARRAACIVALLSACAAGDFGPPRKWPRRVQRPDAPDGIAGGYDPRRRPIPTVPLLANRALRFRAAPDVERNRQPRDGARGFSCRSWANPSVPPHCAPRWRRPASNHLPRTTGDAVARWWFPRAERAPGEDAPLTTRCKRAYVAGPCPPFDRWTRMHGARYSPCWS